MDAQHFQVFKQITLDYFAKLSPGDDPVLEPAYLQFGEPALIDYASLVWIEGEQDGCVYLTSPVELLGSLLEVNGESEVSERTLRDMCRELTNVISGNASRCPGGSRCRSPSDRPRSDSSHCRPRRSSCRFDGAAPPRCW